MDIIITTAMIPGKKAPILIEKKTLKVMKLRKCYHRFSRSIWGKYCWKRIWKASRGRRCDN